MTRRYYRNADPKEKLMLRGTFKPERIYLAEGSAEAEFLEQLLTRRHCDPARHVVFCFRGVDKLETAVKVLSAEDNFSSAKYLKILADADRNPKARYEKMKRILNTHGIPLANAKRSKGALIGIVGEIVLSPSRKARGTIESLVEGEINGTGQWACIRAMSTCVRRNSKRVLPLKLLVQTYVSVHGKRLCDTHQGFISGLLDCEHPTYGPIRDAVLA